MPTNHAINSLLRSLSGFRLIAMMVAHECDVCGEEILIDYAASPKQVNCKCHSVFDVDYDAELIDGSWRDLTKLNLKAKDGI